MGSATILPSFIAFPLGGALLQSGAGYPQVAALVSTAMAVGFVTLPTEQKYFGRSIAWKRNILSVFMCAVFAFVIWGVMG